MRTWPTVPQLGGSSVTARTAGKLGIAPREDLGQPGRHQSIERDDGFHGDESRRLDPVAQHGHKATRDRRHCAIDHARPPSRTLTCRGPGPSEAPLRLPTGGSDLLPPDGVGVDDLLGDRATGGVGGLDPQARLSAGAVATWTVQEVSPHLVACGRQVLPPSQEIRCSRLTTGWSARCRASRTDVEVVPARRRGVGRRQRHPVVDAEHRQDVADSPRACRSRSPTRS